MNREKWLCECIQRIRPDFELVGNALPQKIRASCSGRARAA